MTPHDSTRLHSTELFKIFFSLLTLQLLFCKKLVGREKINKGERKRHREKGKKTREREEKETEAKKEKNGNLSGGINRFSCCIDGVLITVDRSYHVGNIRCKCVHVNQVVTLFYITVCLIKLVISVTSLSFL